MARAVRAVLGKRAIVQRCQVHKARNVLDQLPERMRASVRAALSQAYASGDKQQALQLLKNLERRLAKEHPGAAASLREGLDETLTVVGLGLPRALERTLATTNPIRNRRGDASKLLRRQFLAPPFAARSRRSSRSRADGITRPSPRTS